MHKTVSITINGEDYQHHIPIRMLLVDFIRDVAGLTGTHIACTYEGVCGACTIQLDGEAIKSCLLLAVQADGHQVTTVEGLADGDQPHPLQVAFNQHHALQCGFCTSGILMNAAEFVRDNPGASEDEVRQSLVGNICPTPGSNPTIFNAVSFTMSLKNDCDKMISSISGVPGQ